MEMNVHYASGHQFTDYSDTSVTMNGKSYASNIVVTNTEVTTFAVARVDELQPSDLNSILTELPDLIIFGVAGKITYPKAPILQMLQARGVGFEVMPIQALCRTFNFLISENRKIAAILFF